MPPDLKVVGAGAGATAAAAAALSSGSDALVGVGLIVGLLASGAMLVYHAKRTVEADDPDIDCGCTPLGQSHSIGTVLD